MLCISVKIFGMLVVLMISMEMFGMNLVNVVGVCDRV